MIYFSLFGSIFGLHYILTPKLHTNTFMALDHFNEEHDIKEFATIGELKFFKTSFDNFQVFSNTLNSLYDVELEQEFSVRDPNFILVDSVDTTSVPWHLQRIIQRDLPLKGNFPYTKCHQNKNVTINTYVIDTGIDVSHSEFEGRATWLANFIDNEDSDCQNHGTHCSGLVGSKSYGVCKDANLFAIKVLDCKGSGSTSAVIAGIEFAYKDHLKRRESGNVKSIASMSLGGGYSRALNLAVQNTIRDPNFFFAAAAGNEDSDTCRTSPASATGIFAVMASDRYDDRAYFSNYGKCATIFSPGVDIQSTIPGGKSAVYSGTSMATPIFVGILNHYLDQYPDLTMKTLREKILNDASKNKLTNVPKQTENALVYLNRM